MRQQALPTSLLVLLGAALLIAACLAHNASFFFHEAHVELADFAKDSIRVTTAKTGLMLYGSYSRWGFHHPGPAFFYIFAASEYLFYDWLRLTASPFAAQLLGSAILQCVCVMVALVYALRRINLVIALPAALTILVVHWHVAIGAPASTWPPHLLFGPLLLMIVFGTGVASGDLRVLPLFIAGAGLACHNHVAQPLIAVPLAVLAGIGWLISNRVAPIRLAKTPLIWSALVVAVFASPLVVDVLQGRESNLAKILRHISSHTDTGHTLRQGIGYFLSFVVYERQQALLIGDPGFSLRHYLLANQHLAFLALPILAAVVALWRADRPQSYIRWFIVFVAASVTLCVAWGKMQDGEMFDFNGNFFFAVIYSLYLIPLFAISTLGMRLNKSISGPLAGGAWLVFLATVYGITIPVFGWGTDSPGFLADIRSFAASNKQAYVRFEQSAWIEAFAAINQLDRAGVAFRVANRDYAPLERNEGRHPENDFSLLENMDTVLLDVAEHSSGIAIPSPLERKFVLKPSNLMLLKTGTTDVRALRTHDVTRGFYFDEEFVATEPLAQVLFVTAPRTSDARVTLRRAFPFAGTGRKPSQRVIIRFDSIEIGRFDATTEADIAVSVPSEAWNKPGRHCLTILVPEAQSDMSVGQSGDPRRLGIGFRSITVE